MFSSCLVYGKPVWIISDLVYEADLIFAPLLAFESSTLYLSYLPFSHISPHFCIFLAVSTTLGGQKLNRTNNNQSCLMCLSTSETGGRFRELGGLSTSPNMSRLDAEC